MEIAILSQYLLEGSGLADGGGGSGAWMPFHLFSMERITLGEMLHFTSCEVIHTLKI